MNANILNALKIENLQIKGFETKSIQWCDEMIKSKKDSNGVTQQSLLRLESIQNLYVAQNLNVLNDLHLEKWVNALL